MWLSDFEEAITAMKEHCKWYCFSEIQVNLYGDIIFKPDEYDTFYFVYIRHSKSIYKYYSDTWRNPEHYEVIYAGEE